MVDIVRAEIPVQMEGVELSAVNAEYREYLVGLAEQAMNKRAAERGRKISERPRLVELEQSILYQGIVYFQFEANTQPI